MQYRIEKDFLGERKVPKDVYWGIHTQRAKDNFYLTGYRVNFSFIQALAMVKKACCLANLELNYLKEEKAKAIILACDEIIKGKFSEQFPLDGLQGGAGTSTNMNINEVIANRAIEILGGKKGNYALVDPLREVNLHQSTNDTYPTALKIAVILKIRRLADEIANLQGEFQKKEKEFAAIVKMGRTELQSAVPLTLGMEFSAFSQAFARDRWRTFKCEERLRVVNLGGTAIGTGLTAPQNYIFLVIEKLREITGLGLARGENLVDQTANIDVFVEVSGILKAHAGNLVKIANDLRVLHLLEEIELPAVQVGSSVMPGKVNPVILESAIQAGIKVIANDDIITQVSTRGTFQINEFMPLLTFAALESLDILISINKILAKHIGGIKANALKCKQYCDQSTTLITAFIPYIGYEKASRLLEEFAISSGNNLREFLGEKLGEDRVEQILSPYKLTALGYKNNGQNT